MNIYEYAPKEAIFEETFKHPKVKITKRKKKMPTIDDVKDAALKSTELVFINTLFSMIEPEIQKVVTNQELMDGEYEEAADKNEWECAVDDKVEEAVEPYMPWLSNDWVGKNTTESNVWKEGGVAKFAKSMAKELWKTVTHNKKPNQILSNANIVEAELQAELDQRIEDVKGDDSTADDNGSDDELKEVIVKIKDQIGEKHDTMQVYDDLDIVSDDDDILAYGAAPRLGLDESDVEILRGVRSYMANDAVEYIYNLVQEYKPKGSVKPAAKKTAKKTTAKDEAVGEVESEILFDHDVLVILKDHAGEKDKDMAEEIGVSRQTYTKWQKGNTDISIDDKDTAMIRARYIEHLNELHRGLAILDGTEAITIQ
jgi:hypothetical protein